MKFAIQINAAPYQSQAADSAYHFIGAALERGHRVLRVFFYGDGVYNALRDAKPPDDERHVVRRWSELAGGHGLDLVLCVSAAQRRGLLSAEADQGAGRSHLALAPGFRISGLGQFAEAIIDADRVLVFGG